MAQKRIIKLKPPVNNKLKAKPRKKEAPVPTVKEQDPPTTFYPAEIKLTKEQASALVCQI